MKKAAPFTLEAALRKWQEQSTVSDTISGGRKSQEVYCEVLLEIATATHLTHAKRNVNKIIEPGDSMIRASPYCTGDYYPELMLLRKPFCGDLTPPPVLTLSGLLGFSDGLYDHAAAILQFFEVFFDVIHAFFALAFNDARMVIAQIQCDVQFHSSFLTGLTRTIYHNHITCQFERTGAVLPPGKAQ